MGCNPLSESFVGKVDLLHVYGMILASHHLKYGSLLQTERSQGTSINEI